MACVTKELIGEQGIMVFVLRSYYNIRNLFYKDTDSMSPLSQPEIISDKTKITLIYLYVQNIWYISVIFYFLSLFLVLPAVRSISMRSMIRPFCVSVRERNLSMYFCSSGVNS